jgi:HEPN domain-containing protein
LPELRENSESHACALFYAVAKSRLQVALIGADSLFADARALDRHYIPPRYADAYPSGSPFEFYDEQTAYEALKASERVIEFVRKLKDTVTSDKEGTSG